MVSGNIKGNVLATHSLEGFCLYEDIQIDCGGEGTAQSHDLSHHTLGWDTSLPSSLYTGGCG